MNDVSSGVKAVSPQSTAALFDPVKVGALNLSNRIVMPAMTRTMSPKGVPGDDNAAYYQRRAKGGVGLIIGEGTWVPHDAAANEENAPRMYGDEALSGWRKVTNAVHEEGVPMLAQLWHVGQMKQHMVEGLYVEKPKNFVPPRRVGPSGLFGGIGQSTTLDGDPASQKDIDDIVAAYGTAAENAKSVGFDGVEIHAAHGYLLDQFFWAGTNRRTDSYGGSIRNRVRLAADVVSEIRKRTGPDFTISLRFSQWKVQDFNAKVATSPIELEEFLVPLVDAGVDLFHASQRRFWETEFGTDLNLAAWARKVTGKPAISVGSIAQTGEHIDTLMGQTTQVANIDRLIAMIERGDFDLFAVGRGLLVDPDWARKVKDGRLDHILPWSADVLNTLS